MTIFSLFAGVWMALSSWLGLGPHPMVLPSAPTPMTQQVPAVPVATSTSDAENSDASADTSSVATNTTLAPGELPSGSLWLISVPLGDGKYVTSAPKKGYIYVCHVAQGGGGAEGNPTWIHGTSWTPSEKVAVAGNVSWPNALYSMKVESGNRLITSNGLPTDHGTGIFPIAASDPAYQFDANPNSIKAQNYAYSLPAYPSAAESDGCIYGQVGMMTDGVALFDGFDAEYRDAVAHETQDQWEGHPDVQGVYHNHGFETAIKNETVSQVVGFAFDGYPITGPKLPSGKYITSSDLDECHGMTSTVLLDGKLTSTYHYVLTQDFPYSVSCFHAKSYEPKPTGGATNSPQAGAPPSVGSGQTGIQQTGQGGQPPAPPQAAIDACSGKQSGASCMVQLGPTGTCKTLVGQTSLACIPQ